MLDAFLWFLAPLYALLAMGLAFGVPAMYVVWRKTPRLDPSRKLPEGIETLQVSLLIPARNEEHHIRACVEACLLQSWPHMEVLVVDDNSEDRTADILSELAQEDGRLRVLSGEALPQGWTGKNFALHQAAQAATGDVLLFIDADVQLQPAAVEAGVQLLVEHQAGLLTAYPQLVTKSFWEKVVQPVIGQLVLALFPADQINDPQNPKASGNGPFMMFDAQVYHQLGGHAAVRNDRVEDLALATRVKSAGKGLVYALGSELVSVRMYESLSEIIAGWSKNFYIGLGGKPLPALFGVLGLLLAGIGPYLAIPLGWVLQRELLFWSGLACAVFYLLQRLLAARLYRLDARWAVLQPLAFLVLLWILLRSALAPAPAWKGRSLVGTSLPEARDVH